MPANRERGYVIMAINSTETDYESCAHTLARSIRHWHPDADITIVTRDQLPHGHRQGFANDWQAWWVSPYRQTIKLEADMFMASPCDHWWSMFEKNDVVVSTGARDIYDKPAVSRQYRRVFDENHLPDVYNAITYWRRCPVAQEFWTWVRTIFENWAQYRTLLKFADDEPNTDLVYAMAAQIMGPEKITQCWAEHPRIVHMKPGILPTKIKDWTQGLVWELHQGDLRINTVSQWGAVHYNVKTWRPYG